jgi:hypothetical protein
MAKAGDLILWFTDGGVTLPADIVRAALSKHGVTHLTPPIFNRTAALQKVLHRMYRGYTIKRAAVSNKSVAFTILKTKAHRETATTSTEIIDVVTLWKGTHYVTSRTHATDCGKVLAALAAKTAATNSLIFGRLIAQVVYLAQGVRLGLNGPAYFVPVTQTKLINRLEAALKEMYTNSRVKGSYGLLRLAVPKTSSVAGLALRLTISEDRALCRKLNTAALVRNPPATDRTKATLQHLVSCVNAAIRRANTMGGIMETQPPQLIDLMETRRNLYKAIGTCIRKRTMVKCKAESK